MCNAILEKHPKREPVGKYLWPELRMMEYEGRFIPFTAYLDAEGIYDHDPTAIHFGLDGRPEGETPDELRAKLIAMIDDAIARGAVKAVEPCKLVKKAAA